MKKQILFLAILALFAGTSSFGQSILGSAPRGTTCPDNALNPIAGKPYNYQAAATPTGGNFLFWATKDQNFISTAAGVTTNNLATRLTTPADLLTVSTNYATPAVADLVTITWSDAVLSATTVASPTFVATQYTALAANCADNFRVWSIVPTKAFTVDIRNIENLAPVPLGYDVAEDQCFDITRGASYVGSAMVYDYGTNILFFEVVAANFTVSWTPTFTVTGLMPAGTPVQTSVVEWTYDAPALWNGSTVWHPASTQVLTSATNTSTGVSIYVRVTVTNHNYEGINLTPITLAVDGVNSVNDWDIANNTIGVPGPLCLPGSLNDKQDIAMQTLKARPTLTPVTPTPFVTGNEQN